MIRKEIMIDGTPVPFKASASVPRMYRLKFQRDIFRDMDKLRQQLDGRDPQASDLPLEALDLFENVAYIMAKHADPTIADTVEGWLEGFNTFSIYEVLPELLDLWALNTRTESEAKKKFAHLPAK